MICCQPALTEQKACLAHRGRRSMTVLGLPGTLAALHPAITATSPSSRVQQSATARYRLREIDRQPCHATGT